jgi:phenylacetate-CoA ligase
MFYNQKMETLPREELEQLQIERLQSTLNRVYRNVAFYKNLFDSQKIDISRIQSVSDLRRLPFTTKEDLNKSYPYDMFAVPLKDIVRIHTTSGTTGRPVVVGYTKNDIRHWSELVARLLFAGGVTEHDLVMVAFNYSLFTGGLGFHYGAELIGASVVPASESSDIRKQIQIMKDYKTTALVSTPNYALKLIRGMKEMGVRHEELFLKAGLFGAETWSENVRGEIEASLGITAFDNYGISEVMGPGISGECAHKNGLHVNEDHFIVEVINPKTLEEVAEGTEGELAITTLTKEGFPLIRFRTGDRASLLSGPCACSRTFARMSRVSGRTDDVIIVRGVALTPARIEEALFEVEKVTPHYQVVIDQKNGVDEMEIKVEVSEKLPFFDEVKRLEHLKADIAKHVHKELNLTAKISFVEPNSLRTEPGRKESRVKDLRKE